MSNLAQVTHHWFTPCVSNSMIPFSHHARHLYVVPKGTELDSCCEPALTLREQNFFRKTLIQADPHKCLNCLCIFKTK